MARLAFIATTLGGRTTYLVTESHIDITSFRWAGRRDLKLPLYDLREEPRFASRRRWGLAVSSLVVASGVIWLMFRLGSFGEPLSGFVMYLTAVVAPPLAVGLRALWPFERYEFLHRNGTPRFRVFREPHQRQECDAFAAQLQTCIALTRQDVTDAHRTELLRRLECPPQPQPEYFWRLAIGLGVSAAALPFFGDFARDAGGAMVVIVLSFAGMISAAVSFQRSERLRWLSIVGGACALVPTFLF